MSRHTFEYLTLRGRHYPLIPIRIYHGESSIRTYALVDSGSTLSVFRAEIADSLGVSIEKGERMVLQSVNAPLVVYVHKLRAELNGESFQLRVAFSEDLLTSFNMLGREGFFERFRVIFSERERVLTIES